MKQMDRRRRQLFVSSQTRVFCWDCGFGRTHGVLYGDRLFAKANIPDVRNFGLCVQTHAKLQHAPTRCAKELA